MDAGFKQPKVISRGEDGGWKRVPVSGVIGIKELAKPLVRFLFNLISKGC